MDATKVKRSYLPPAPLKFFLESAKSSFEGFSSSTDQSIVNMDAHQAAEVANVIVAHKQIRIMGMVDPSA